MRSLRKNDFGGATLLELLAAIGLLAIVATTATLRYPILLAEWRLHEAARQVVVDLKRARLQAITEGVSHRLCFSPGASSYRQQRREEHGYVDEGAPTALPAGITVVECSARYDSVSFQPRGHAGSFGKITITNQLGRQHQVVVDMVGRVRVQ